jgi:hypothetical protein
MTAIRWADTTEITVADTTEMAIITTPPTQITMIRRTLDIRTIACIHRTATWIRCIFRTAHKTQLAATTVGTTDITGATNFEILVKKPSNVLRLAVFFVLIYEKSVLFENFKIWRPAKKRHSNFDFFR